MTEKSTTYVLQEPNAPEALVPDSQVEPWMIALASLLFLTLLTVLVFKKKQARPISSTTIRDTARAEAAAALAQIGPVPAREAALQSSLILRRYLSLAVGDPALFETHEEYLSRHEALKEFSQESRESAGLGFSRLAAIKYAAAQPEMEADRVVADSTILLETLHHGFRA